MRADTGDPQYALKVMRKEEKSDMEAMTQDEARRQAHYEKMTQTPVPKLVTTLAIPTIISMMVSAIYNMADTFFVSQLGTSAVGGGRNRIFPDGNYPGRRLYTGYGFRNHRIPASGGKGRR